MKKEEGVEGFDLSVGPGRERDVRHGIAFLVDPWNRASTHYDVFYSCEHALVN